MAITTGAALGAAGIGALGSIIGGLFGSSSQSSANETNLQAVRETNQQNRELFNQSLAWQEDMWNKNNLYNSYKSQMERAHAAGINPAALFGSGSTSNASMPSVPSAPQMQAGQVHPVNYDWLGNVVDHGVNAYLNSQILSNNVVKSAADAQISKANAEFQTMSLQDRLMQIANDSKKSQYERDMARDSMEILNGTKRWQILGAEKGLEMTNRQIEELDTKIAANRIANQLSQIDLKWRDKKNSVEYQSYLSNIANSYAAARNNDASAVSHYASAAVANAQAAGIKLDNANKRDMSEAIVNKAYYEADEQQHKAGQARKLYYGGRVGAELPVPFDKADRGELRIPDYGHYYHSSGR